MADKNFKVKNGLTIEGGATDTNITADGSGGILVNGAAVGASEATPTVKGTVFGNTDTPTSNASNRSVAIGYNAGLKDNGYNVAIGYQTHFDGQYKPAYGVAIGHEALKSTSGTYYSIGIGWRALANDNGGSNVGIGAKALLQNSNGYYNVGVGYYALRYTTTGYHNVAIGSKAGQNVTTGYRNVAIGPEALQGVFAGIDNIGIGYQSKVGNGNNNISIGFQSGFRWDGIATPPNNAIAIGYKTLQNTFQDNGLAIGHYALNLSRSSTNNAIGYNSQKLSSRYPNSLNIVTAGSTYTNGTYNNLMLEYQSGTIAEPVYANVTVSGGAVTSVTYVSGGAGADTTTRFYRYIIGSTGNGSVRIGVPSVTEATGNVSFGYESLLSNRSGNNNTAVGHESLRANTFGNFNTAIGRKTLFANTYGTYNTAVGYYSLSSTTFGTNNAAFGDRALQSNTTGNNNVAVGSAALYYNTTGSHNVAIGLSSLYSNVSGYSNVAVGRFASRFNTSGYYNVSVGTFALEGLSTGYGNTAVGHYALKSNGTGYYNTAIGRNAGYGPSGSTRMQTGSNNTFVGHYAIPSSSSVSNTITLGNSSIATLRCQVTTITALSDGRDKTNIESIPVGLDFINDLKPVKFTWDTRPILDEDGNEVLGAGGKHDIDDLGFIAQDLLATEEKFNTHDWTKIVDTTNPDKLEAGYGKIVPILVKAVQELSAKIEELESKIN